LINDDTFWKIPVIISTKSTYPKINTKVVLETPCVELNLGKMDKTDWILLNTNTISFHRTIYAPDLFDLLKNDIDKLNPSDRLMLQNNAFAFVLHFNY
jgi:hypothetical protein